MASNFALVKMQLFFEAVLLLATLVTKLCTYSHTCAINPPTGLYDYS